MLYINNIITIIFFSLSFFLPALSLARAHSTAGRPPCRVTDPKAFPAVTSVGRTDTEKKKKYNNKNLCTLFYTQTTIIRRARAAAAVVEYGIHRARGFVPTVFVARRFPVAFRFRPRLRKGGAPCTYDIRALVGPVYIIIRICVYARGKYIYAGPGGGAACVRACAYMYQTRGWPPPPPPPQTQRAPLRPAGRLFCRVVIINEKKKNNTQKKT